MSSPIAIDSRAELRKLALQAARPDANSAEIELYRTHVHPRHVLPLLDALERAETERNRFQEVAGTFQRKFADADAHLAQAEARIQAARDLHSSSDEQVIMGDCAAEECDHQEIEDCPTEPFTVCAECYRAAIELNPYYGEQGVNDVAWPCATIRALDDAR